MLSVAAIQLCNIDGSHNDLRDKILEKKMTTSIAS